MFIYEFIISRKMTRCAFVALLLKYLSNIHESMRKLNLVHVCDVI